MDTLEARIRGVISEVTGVPAARLTLDLDLIDSGTTDSLQALEVITAIERTLDVTLPDGDVGSLTTIRAISQAIRRPRDQALGTD